MAILEQESTVNGELYEFAKIQVKILGDRYFSFKSIEYTPKRNGKKIWGSGQDPIGGTSGTRDSDASIELLKEEWDKLRPLLMQKAIEQGLDGYGRIRFDVLVSYRKSLLTAEKTDIIEMVRVVEAPNSRTQGEDGLYTKLKLEPLGILENGTDRI